MNTRYFLAELDHEFKQLGFAADCSIKTAAHVEYGVLSHGALALELFDIARIGVRKPSGLLLRSSVPPVCMPFWRREDGTFDYADMAKRAMEWFMTQKETQNG